jgi:hypothetical protein
VGGRYGHGLFERAGRGARDGRGRGSSIGGNVFWKQWHFPVKTNGSLREDEYDDSGGPEYWDPSEAGQGEMDSDRRPWTDLIPRFRVKVEPMTTLKVRLRGLAGVGRV